MIIGHTDLDNLDAEFVVKVPDAQHVAPEALAGCQRVHPDTRAHFLELTTEFWVLTNFIFMLRGEGLQLDTEHLEGGGELLELFRGNLFAAVLESGFRQLFLIDRPDPRSPHDATFEGENIADTICECGFSCLSKRGHKKGKINKANTTKSDMALK